MQTANDAQQAHDAGMSALRRLDAILATLRDIMAGRVTLK